MLKRGFLSVFLVLPAMVALASAGEITKAEWDSLPPSLRGPIVITSADTVYHNKSGDEITEAEWDRLSAPLKGPIAITSADTVYYDKNGEEIGETELRGPVVITPGDFVYYNKYGNEVTEEVYWMLPVPLRGTIAITSADTVYYDNNGNEITEAEWDRLDPYITAVEEFSHTQSLPKALGLSQNYPNPFNSGTAINFQTTEDSNVSLRVYNLLGQEVAALVNGYLKTGVYGVRWDGKDAAGRPVASGIYLYQLKVDEGNWTKTERMLLLR